MLINATQGNALLHSETEVQQDIVSVSRHYCGTPRPITTLNFSKLEVCWVLGCLHEFPCLFTNKGFVAIVKNGCMIPTLVGNYVKVAVLSSQSRERLLIPSFHFFIYFILKAGTIPTLQSLRGVNGWLSYAFINITLFKKNQKKIFQKKK